MIKAVLLGAAPEVANSCGGVIAETRCCVTVIVKRQERHVCCCRRDHYAAGQGEQLELVLASSTHGGRAVI
jgi:hypothetical protein